MNLTDFFDHIYIINLPHRTDRREEVIKELQGVGIQLEAGKVEIFPAIKPERMEPFHRLGIKGCFLSILNALKLAQEQGKGHVLIFEDDVEFPDFFEEEIGGLLEKLNEQPWDIAQFGYLRVEDADPGELDASFASWKNTSKAAIGTHFFGVNGHSLDRYIQFLEGLLTRPRNHPEGGPMPADGAITVFRWLNPDVVKLIAIPSFGHQRKTRSDVTPKWFDKIPVVSTLAELYRGRK